MTFNQHVVLRDTGQLMDYILFPTLRYKDFFLQPPRTISEAAFIKGIKSLCCLIPAFDFFIP